MASEGEKELAILKGRVDSLEAKVEEIEYQLRNINTSGVLVIDEYDISTGSIKKSAKVINTSARYSRWIRLSSENSAIFSAYEESVIFKDNNESGLWPTVSIRQPGFASMTGKDLVIGPSFYNEDLFISSGTIPSPEGSWFIINKQKV